MLAVCVCCLVFPACRKTLKTASQPLTTEELLQQLRPVLAKYLKKMGVELDDALSIKAHRVA